MHHLARQTFSISLLVAAFVIGAQNFAIQYVDTIKTLVLPRWFELAVAAGLTTVLYKLLMEFYKRWAWRWFNGELVLAGHWTHKLIPTDRRPNTDRLGRFEVLQTPFEIRIVCGENYNSDGTLTSHWRSLAVSYEELANRRLWVIYEIVRGTGTLVVGETETDRGLLAIDLAINSRGRITKMSGTHWDAGRSQHKGYFEASFVGTKAMDTGHTITAPA